MAKKETCGLQRLWVVLNPFDSQLPLVPFGHVLASGLALGLKTLAIVDISLLIEPRIFESSINSS